MVLVLSDFRPACILTSSMYTTSKQQTEIFQAAPGGYSYQDALGKLLLGHDIPHTLKINVKSESQSDLYRVVGIYYISFSEERRDKIDSAISSRTQFDDNETHRVVGRFLGYPNDVVEAWCVWNHETDQTLFDQISNGVVLDRLGPFSPLIEESSVEPASFAEFLLPYVVPAGVDNCEQRIFNDLKRYLAAGRLLSYEHNINLFGPLIERYKWGREQTNHE